MLKPRRQRAWRGDHVVAANRPGRAVGRARRHEHGEPACCRRAALLKERHPGWSVAQIKSAIVQTADPVRNSQGREISVLREGGGLINLVWRAGQPADLRSSDPRSPFRPTAVRGGRSS